MDAGSILGAIFTGGTGGLLGVVGNVANTFMAIKQKKLDYEHEQVMLPLQMQLEASRASQAIEQTKADVAKVVEQGASAAFVASQEADKATGRESPWALNVRAMVRPACLFLLGIGTVAIYLSGNVTQTMQDYIIQNVVCDFSMAISWYFGARASDKVMAGFKSKAGN